MYTEVKINKYTTSDFKVQLTPTILLIQINLFSTYSISVKLEIN